MTNHDPELRLRQALAALPREVLPDRDLWPGIAHALQEGRPRRATPNRLALAASLVLMLGASVYYGVRQPGVSLTQAELGAVIATLQSTHRDSKQALLVQYQGQPAAYADWEGQMQELETAEEVIYRALRQDPGNRGLLNILREVQDKQIMLIDAVFAPHLSAI